MSIHEGHAAGGNNDFRDAGQMFRDELKKFEDDCAALAKLAVKANGDLDEEAIAANQKRFADLVGRECELRKTAISRKDEEKKPYWDECQRIDAAHRNVIAKLADALKSAKSKFDAWILAEDAKREVAEKEARAAVERAEREAEAVEAKAAAGHDPFAAFEAQEEVFAARNNAQQASFAAAAIPERTKIASNVGRSVSVRTSQTVEVIDYAAAFATVAENKAVKEAIEKAVKAAHKATGAVPAGCKLVEVKAVR